MELLDLIVETEIITRQIVNLIEMMDRNYTYSTHENIIRYGIVEALNINGNIYRELHGDKKLSDVLSSYTEAEMITELSIFYKILIEEKKFIIDLIKKQRAQIV